jgi:hypothetical protein
MRDVGSRSLRSKAHKEPSCSSAVPEAQRLDSMHAVTPDGRVWSSGQAVRVILAELPGGSILASIADAFPVRSTRSIDWSPVIVNGSVGSSANVPAASTRPRAVRPK